MQCNVQYVAAVAGQCERVEQLVAVIYTTSNKQPHGLYICIYTFVHIAVVYEDGNRLTKTLLVDIQANLHQALASWC